MKPTNQNKRALIVFIVWALIVVALLSKAHGQTNDKTPFIMFYGALDVKNAIQGSEPTNNKPALDYLLGVTIPICKTETNIGIERFEKIGFTKFFTAVGYHVPIVKEFNSTFKELSVTPAIEGGVIWRTIDNNFDSSLTYGLNLSIRQDIGENWAIESFSNFSRRSDKEHLYPNGEKQYVYSHYIKLIYKLNL